ncbi:MAG: FAD-binding oxidoreductase [Micromonosporaceae bacterium]|nr:FAD-binding oxidoreductase [Micromonosporaceae bacterium]
MTDTLRSQISAPVVLPNDPEYDDVRSIHNAMIDRRPAAIARCRSVVDVQSALAAGQRAGLPIAVRGGGHNGPGFGTVEGGLVIDLSAISQITVDPQARTVRVGGGAVWRDVDAATHAHGLATVSGIVGSTGVGGLTLGGGHGYLSRKYGLTIDNLLEAEVVLADGRVVTASEDQHPDLFWALRGGGGNFGIVTSFTFRLHPVATVYCGPTAWPASATADVLRWYKDFLPSQPPELTGFFATLTVPPVPPFPEPFHMHKACAVVWCYTGDPADADEVFTPIRAAEPAWDGTHVAPYPALQSAFDGLYPKGLQWYWRGAFVRDVPEQAVAIHTKFTEELPTLHSGMHLYPVDGAVWQVGSDETAWAFRDVTFSQVIIGVDPDPAKAADITRWTKEYDDALRPYTAGAGYVNFSMDDGNDRVRAMYGPNYDRLTQIKATYDPRNVFRINQNIPPATR